MAACPVGYTTATLRLLHSLPPGRWLTLPQIATYYGVRCDRDLCPQLRAAASDGLILTCRRKWVGRAGRPANLFYLSALGELAVYGRLVTKEFGDAVEPLVGGG